MPRDQWGAPTPEHWSARRRFVLTVAWKSGIALWAVNAKTRTKLWATPFPQEYPPLRAHVADDGQHVVLADCHSSLGYGKVLVFLGPDGKILRSYELSDLFNQDQSLRTMRSVSSIFWSVPEGFAFLPGEARFAFRANHGIDGLFEVATGAPAAWTPETRAEFHRVLLARVAPGLTSRKREIREQSAMLVGDLRLPEALPTLRPLADDPDPDVRQAALTAWVKLSGGEVIPVLRKRLSVAGADERAWLLGLLSQIDVDDYFDVRVVPGKEDTRGIWRRLLKSSHADVRKVALVEALKREPGAFVVASPQYLSHPDKKVRFEAICCLAERGDRSAVPLLRKALRDADDVNRIWAFDGLVKHRAEGLDALLCAAARDPKCAYRRVALRELVQRNDPWALQMARRALESHSFDLFDVMDLCRWIAEHRRSDFRDALRTALREDGTKIGDATAYLTGALAVLGDLAALVHLRRLAESRDEVLLVTAPAIEFLGLAHDTASRPKLEAWRTDREPWVREAAQKALARLGGAR